MTQAELDAIARLMKAAGALLAYSDTAARVELSLALNNAKAVLPEPK